jgi:ribonuclease T1
VVRRRNPVAYVGVLVAVLVAAWVTGNFDFKPEKSSTEQAQPKNSEQAQIDATLDLIARGGPFPHRQDGSVFQNREGRLPSQPRGYYREYTVPTPGAGNRGARRIVVGQNGEKWYTRDHYRTFVRLD